MDNLIYAVPAMGIIGLLYTFIKFAWVSRQEDGNDRMREIATYIQEGAMAFLRAEYKIMAYFGVIVAILLGFMGSRNTESHWSIALAFILGAFFSALAGYIGMRVATKANVRTAHAARTSLGESAKRIFYRRCSYGYGRCRD
jgi:K(+)-stimulated pyrophosphate-energized sodium pump